MSDSQLHQRKTCPWIIAIIAVVTVIGIPAWVPGIQRQGECRAEDHPQSAQSETLQSTDSQSVDLQSGDTPSPAPIPTEITKPVPQVRRTR